MAKMSLKAARVNAEMSQSDACKALGVSKKTLSHWENGVTFPNAMQISEICKLYKVDFDNLNFCN